MAHREDFSPVRGALGAALAGIAQRGGARALEPLWERACGMAMARVTRPIAFDDGTLVIEVESSAWLRALNGQRDMLCGRLREQVPGFRALTAQLKAGAR